EIGLTLCVLEQVELRCELPAPRRSDQYPSSRTLWLVQPERQPAAVLHDLECPQADRKTAHLQRAYACLAAGLPVPGQQRAVQVLRLHHDAALEPGPDVRQKRVGQLMAALVGKRVGEDRRAEKAQAQHVAGGLMAVPSIVQQGGSVAGLGEV